MCDRTRESLLAMQKQESLLAKEERQGISRRDLLKTGGKALVGMAFMPTLYHLMREEKALATGIPSPALHITITQAAGTSHSSFWAAQATAGGNLPASLYSQYGADGTTLSTLSTTFGAPMFTSTNMTAGTTTTNIPALLAAANLSSTGLQFATFAHSTNDDTKGYVYDSSAVSSQLNVNGARTSSLKIVSSQLNGGSSLETLGGYSPVAINSVSAYQGLVAAAGPLAALSATQIGALTGLATSIGNNSNAALSATGVQSGSALGSAFSSGLNATATAFSVPGGPPSPFTDSRVSAFNLSPAGGTPLAPNSKQAVMASLVMLALDGHTQAIMFNDPQNWDIHTITGTQMMAQTLELWTTVVIPTIQTLVTQKIPFVIEFLTDGSANWNNPFTQGGTTQGDASRISMNVMAAYVPGVASPFSSFHSGGYLTTTGDVDLKATPASPVTGTVPAAAIRAVTALNVLKKAPGLGNLNPGLDSNLSNYLSYSLA